MESVIEENVKRSGSDILKDVRDVPEFDFGRTPSMTDEEIDSAYNGTGPDRWPQEIRDKIDEYVQFFSPAVVVHDCDFTASDGTNDGLAISTSRFRRNTKAILKHYYPLWTWKWIRDKNYRRERAKYVAIKITLDIGVSEDFCKKAWDEAHEKNYVKSLKEEVKTLNSEGEKND